MQLVEGFEQKGHHVYMDNLYTSIPLFESLMRAGIGACGTVRINRRGLPTEIKKTIKKGEVVHNKKNGILALKWKDKRDVSMLSTIHNHSMVIKRRRTRLAAGGFEEIQKPLVVDQYNSFMGGVDRNDQLLSYYGFAHRTVKWWKRLFLHLLDIAVINSYTMYTESRQDKRLLTHKEFRISLAKALLFQSGEPVEALPHQPGLVETQPYLRLTERHFLEHTPSLPCGQPQCYECSVCTYKKGRGRVRTTFRCKQCQVALCVVPCFELYHTKTDPTRHLPTNP